MPSAEFLLTVPLKTTWDVALATALKAIFKEAGHSSKDEAVASGVAIFDQFRKEVANRSLPKTYASLELLYRYHDQLIALMLRLPALVQKPLPKTTIYWEDAIDKGGFMASTPNVATSHLEVERLCILFNIAALQSHLAKESRAVDTDEELKNAAKLYQSAATIFSSLAEYQNPTIQTEKLTADMKPDVLTALSAVMLAQAQEMFVDKAIKDRMKENITAKLCSVAEEMFADASSKLNKDTVKYMWDKDWIGNVSGKKVGYEGLSQYFQSFLCASKQQHGEQIARLELAMKSLKKSQDTVGSKSFLSNVVAEAEGKYKQAKKDNDLIYLDLVPSAESLVPVEKVGSARLAKLGTLPDNFATNFKDVFEGAKSKNDGDGDGPTLKSILNTTVGSLGQYLVNLSKK